MHYNDVYGDVGDEDQVMGSKNKGMVMVLNIPFTKFIPIALNLTLV
jgi:hypothetical protein